MRKGGRQRRDPCAIVPSSSLNGFGAFVESPKKPEGDANEEGAEVKIKPLGGRVLVKQVEPEEKKSPGGIVLPEGASSTKTVRGKVLAVGTDEKIEVKRGDVVLVPQYGGTEVLRDREKLLIVKASDILAVVDAK